MLYVLLQTGKDMEEKSPTDGRPKYEVTLLLKLASRA